MLSVTVHHGTDADTQTLCDSVLIAQGRLLEAGHAEQTEAVAADKGYHSAATLADAGSWGLLTYIPEPDIGRRRWKTRPDEQRNAVLINRRHVCRSHSKRLQKKRSELLERSFAHQCNSGGGRRAWLRGLQNIQKRSLITTAGQNLGLVMRKLIGAGKPRAFAAAITCLTTLIRLLNASLELSPAFLDRYRQKQQRSPALCNAM